MEAPGCLISPHQPPVLSVRPLLHRYELKRFLVALMADNPDVDLDERALDEIVDQVGPCSQAPPAAVRRRRRRCRYRPSCCWVCCYWVCCRSCCR